MKWHQRSSSIYLIVNPVAKGYSKRAFDSLLKNLKEAFDKNIEVFYTTKRGDAEEFARSIASEGGSVILVVGGDGTLNEAINGIANTDLPLGFIPSGTTNVAAKEFGIKEHYQKALRQLLEAEPRRITLGRINGRYFLLMAGAGFDGYSVKGVNPKIKALTGKGAYILSGTKVFLKDRLPTVEVGVNGLTYRATSVIVANASCYGGRFRVCPEASVFDENLDVAIFEGSTRRAMLRYITGIVTGTHLRYKDVIFLKTDRLTIKGTTHIQIDGDYFGLSPAEVETVPKGLNFLMPQ
ncbi:MAG: diacylglycerol kinase family lipid kinase [Nitrospirae bacterium]|nr:MAG: diacylglycerol kinase family lipid kinase [Nitrospirota bacterium]